MLIRIFITLIFSVVLILEVNAGTGTSNFPFLRIMPDARIIGMGETYAGIYSNYFNPSGLSKAKEIEVSLSYLRYWMESNYGYIGISSKIGENQGIGGYIIYLDYGRFDQTAEDVNGLPDDSRSGGSYGAADIAVGLSYGMEISDRLSAGISGKIISERIDTDNLIGYGMDLGVLYSLPSGADIGIVLQNLGTKTKEKDLPLTLKAGLSIGMGLINPEDLVIAVDSSYLFESKKIIWNVGAEYLVMDMIFVRGGYKTGSEQESITYGIGFKVLIDKYLESRIDYAFVPSKDLESTHRISLSIGGGKISQSVKSRRVSHGKLNF
jgi:hypothetical protein